MQTTNNTNDKNTTIEVLNSFLRGEISAVETYKQAIDKLSGTPYAARLNECKASHEGRVGLLRDRIVELGGAPAKESGAWGSFAKLVQGGANLFGEKSAIASLEEGEDHGRDDYQRDLAKLDAQTRQFIETRIVPDQQRTHDAVRNLKKAVA